MKQFRTIPILVFVLGLLYLSVGIFTFYQYYEITQFLDGVSNLAQSRVGSIVELRDRYFDAFKVFTSIALPVLLSSIGLRFTKEWARKFWLGLVLLLTGFHIYRFATDIHGENYVLVIRTIEVILIVVVALFSWKQLTSEKQKNLFRRGVEKAT